jgi:hypothetical protein
MLRSMLKKYIVCYLVVAMFVIGIAPRVDAAFAPSHVIPGSSADRSSDIQRVRSVLEMKLVQQRLQDLGYTADEITGRLSQLSDQQIHGIAQKLDDLKVGQDSGLGIVIALLVIAVLVIVIIQLTTGHRIVVTK